MTAWSAPRTWASETMTSTLLNTHLRDNLNHLAEQTSRAGWTSFTPSWTNLTTTSGTNTGKYGYSGKTSFFYIEFTFGASSSIGGVVSVAFPETAVTYLGAHPVAVVTLYDASPLNYYEGWGYWASTAGMSIASRKVSGSYLISEDINATLPFTWATGDKIMIHGFFERA
jgi:hypothetical protein